MSNTHFGQKQTISEEYSPPLPATTGDLQFPFELHKREIIRNLTDA